MIGGNGLPVVTSQITINGLHTTIAGNPASAMPFRIFEVAPTGNLTLQGLTITGGVGTLGGGIVNNAGTLTLNHSQVTGNTAVQAGGGIGSGNLGMSSTILGTLTLNSSQVNGNTTGGTGGGIAVKYGTAVLNASSVSNNTAGASAGGIADVGGALSLNFSQVNNNTAQGGGGGIANGNGMGGVGPPSRHTQPLLQPGEQQHVEGRPDGWRGRHR